MTAKIATQIDLLIEPGWIIPIEPADVVLEGHALVVHQGRIVALLPVDQALAQYEPHEHLRLPGEVLLPGLVNAHTHAAMSLLRGFADDLPLMNWLQERIWPAEKARVDPDFIYDGTLLASWEMLRSGVTCFSDMYFYPDSAARAAVAAGIRAVIGATVIDFPTRYASDADDYLQKGLAARDAWRDEPRVSFTLAPHAPYTVSDQTFTRVGTLAAQIDVPIHVHVHETRQEIDESLARHGVRPLERLHRLGLLGPNLIAVHAVHLDVSEIKLLQASGAFVVHCPSSNLKLASGFAPIAALLEQGVRVALGTDGAASNNRLDILTETRLASLLAKAVTGNAGTLGAHQALRMATLHGAQALGLGQEIGSLESGKWADLCTVRLDDWFSQPCYDPASHLVYVAGRDQVSHVWVAGRQRIRHGNMIDASGSDLIGLANSWHNRLNLRGLGLTPQGHG